ncbi:MAG TPA: protein kinase, partial [Polyangiaceae bacterium]|nr:protein kinase [Polyangiaceae bacterium]
MSVTGSHERVPNTGASESLTGFRAPRTVEERTGIPLGTVIADRYRVESVLGEGAMGIVLAARHLELDELVAIKCIRAAMPWSPDVIARFAREAKAAARLKSEHIAKVIDVGVSAPVGPYMVMEHLEGEDLAGVLKRRGPLPVRRAAEYVMQVCEALAVAHAASITHRDVKPENLFLTRHGDLEIIKVLDFGISKTELQGRLFGGELSVKETQTLMGTPLYMSPEQIRSSREIDHRSDLWSLGVVLFELLTGRPAFAGASVTQVCSLVLEAETPRLGEFCRQAPPELAAVIDRCLMKEPAQRFQSAAELASALLPFAPARARLHAERATSVLRAVDPSGGDPVPSSLPEARRVPDSTLNTAAPTVLGADAASRGAGSRSTPLVVGFVALACLGLGFAGYRGLSDASRGPATLGATAVPSAATLPATPGMPGRADAPETKARSPSVQPAGDAALRPPPALTPSVKAKVES